MIRTISSQNLKGDDDSSATGCDMRYNFFEIENRAEFLPTLYGSKKNSHINIFNLDKVLLK